MLYLFLLAASMGLVLTISLQHFHLTYSGDFQLKMILNLCIKYAEVWGPL